MRRRLPLLIVVGSAALLAVVLLLQPTPLDWRPDYEGDSARPLGARVLRELLPRWLAGPDGQGARVISVADPPFLRLADTTLRGTAYWFLTDAFEPAEAETARLMQYAARGNTVFVAADEIVGPLADTLGHPDGEGGRIPLFLYYRGVLDDSTLHLVGPGLRREGGYRLPLEAGPFAIENLDSVRATTLATRADTAADGRSAPAPVLTRVRVGRGQVLVSSTPRAFSNAALVGDGDGAAYVAGVLGYVEARTVFWDEHYKPLRALENQTPLRHVLREPALRWAYGLTLLGVALFVVFRGRRWQRAIPEIKPPSNAAVEFVRTLGRLYFQHGDGRALVERKARFFFDRLRARHGLSELGLADFSEETERLVSRRTGAPPHVVAAVFARFRRLSRTARPAPVDLVELDRALDWFHRASRGEG